MRAAQPRAVPITGDVAAAANHRNRAVHPQINLLQNLPQLYPKGLHWKPPKALARVSNDRRRHGAVAAVPGSNQRHPRFRHRHPPILPRRRQHRNNNAALDARTRRSPAPILGKAATYQDNANNAANQCLRAPFA